jgi:zinc transport system ATP-binding protein
MTEEMVEIQNVTAGYGQTAVLDNVNLLIEKGSFTGIIGPNGGGKTTLLKLMLGLIKPWKGQVKLLGYNPRKKRHCVGYVPQASTINMQFPISIRQVVLSGRLAGMKPFWHHYRHSDLKIVDQCLSRLDILDLAERQIGQISRGQLQRVLIARALAVQPAMLLLDEPTNGLDASASSHLYELLQKLNDEMTIIMVTHDTLAISAYVKDIACINRSLYYHGEPNISQELVLELYGCPVDLIAHGVPHRVLEEHGGIE